MKGAKVEVTIEGDTVTFIRSEQRDAEAKKAVEANKTEEAPKEVKTEVAVNPNVKKIVAIGPNKDFFRLDGHTGWFAFSEEVTKYVAANPF